MNRLETKPWVKTIGLWIAAFAASLAFAYATDKASIDTIDGIGSPPLVWIMSTLGIIALPLCVLGIFSYFIALLLALKSKRSPTGAFRNLTACLLFLLGAVPIERMNIFLSPGQYLHEKLQACAARSGTLIAAIRAFEQEQGRPPASLEELVPKYLPEIPATGIGGYPEYRYYVSEDAEGFDGGNPWKLEVYTPDHIFDFQSSFTSPSRTTRP